MRPRSPTTGSSSTEPFVLREAPAPPRGFLYLCFMDGAIVNRVAESGIITLDLKDLLPRDEMAIIDLKDYLFMGLILREKDFRATLSAMDWTAYQDRMVILTCSTDAIIPAWAYMLLATYLQPYAREIHQGTPDNIIEQLWAAAAAQIPTEGYRDQRVVVKGCGDREVPASVYVAVASRLRPIAKSVMYGEACSAVPIFKRK